jgi:hypothetical protein
VAARTLPGTRGSVTKRIECIDERFITGGSSDPRAFTNKVFPHFLELRRALHDALAAADGPDVCNWYEHMVALSAGYDMAEPRSAAFA